MLSCYRAGCTRVQQQLHSFGVVARTHGPKGRAYTPRSDLADLSQCGLGLPRLTLRRHGRDLLKTLENVFLLIGLLAEFDSRPRQDRHPCCVAGCALMYPQPTEAAAPLVVVPFFHLYSQKRGTEFSSRCHPPGSLQQRKVLYFEGSL